MKNQKFKMNPACVHGKEISQEEMQQLYENLQKYLASMTGSASIVLKDALLVSWKADAGKDGKDYAPEPGCKMAHGIVALSEKRQIFVLLDRVAKEYGNAEELSRKLTYLGYALYDFYEMLDEEEEKENSRFQA